MRRVICSLVLVGLIGSAAFAGHSRSKVSISFSLSQPVYQPVYVNPQPLYYPAPVYRYPAPVCSYPQPAYIYSAPVYVPQTGYALSFSWGKNGKHFDRDNHWNRGHNRQGWRGHR